MNKVRNEEKIILASSQHHNKFPQHFRYNISTTCLASNGQIIYPPGSKTQQSLYTIKRITIQELITTIYNEKDIY